MKNVITLFLCSWTFFTSIFLVFHYGHNHNLGSQQSSLHDQECEFHDHVSENINCVYCKTNNQENFYLYNNKIITETFFNESLVFQNLRYLKSYQNKSLKSRAPPSFIA